MPSRRFSKFILGFAFWVTSGFALSNTQFTYNLIDTGIEIKGCDGTCPEELFLPAKINGIDVTNIADNAFKESGIKKIVIPNSTNISSKAFASNSLLEVVFLDDLGVVSEDAFLIAEHNKYPEIFLKNGLILDYKASMEQLLDERGDLLREIDYSIIAICPNVDCDSGPGDIVRIPNITSIESNDSSISDGSNSAISINSSYPCCGTTDEIISWTNHLVSLSVRLAANNSEIQELEEALITIETEIYNLITSSYDILNAAEYSSLKQNYDSCASDDFSCKLTADIALYKYSHCDENDEICIAAAYRGDEILREDVFYYCSNSTGIAEKSIATSKSYFYELTEPYDYDGCYSSCPECMDCGGMPPIPEGSEIIERVYTHSSTPELKQNCDEIISDYPLEIFDSEQVKTDYSILDMDQNGNFDALTDGLILIRYAFGLRGDSLISNAVASDANRTSAEEIETHIQSLLP